MPVNNKNEANKSTRPASSGELNSWKRGFTPQAEIWNGRMATVGIGFLLLFITILNKFSS